MSNIIETNSTTILLVDDEKILVELMSKRLITRNYIVFTASSGIEALEVLKTNKTIDIVILDVKMAGMDGIETLKLIKKSYPLVEVIMLTGYPQVDDAIDCMRFGAYDYLKKVVDFDNLLVKITLAKQKKLTGEENALK